MPGRADKVTLSADPTNWNINLPPNHGLYLPLIDNFPPHFTQNMCFKSELDLDLPSILAVVYLISVAYTSISVAIYQSLRNLCHMK